MSRVTGTVAALGEWALVRGYALAGVTVLAAEDADAVRAAWRTLEPDVEVVILTPAAAAALGGVIARERPMTVVMPE
jgi:vacuolar-type H+-ATPase subunit F/Vma7